VETAAAAALIVYWFGWLLVLQLQQWLQPGNVHFTQHDKAQLLQQQQWQWRE
jgi:hypothetical protein